MAVKFRVKTHRFFKKYKNISPNFRNQAPCKDRMPRERGSMSDSGIWLQFTNRYS